MKETTIVIPVLIIFLIGYIMFTYILYKSDVKKNISIEKAKKERRNWLWVLVIEIAVLLILGLISYFIYPTDNSSLSLNTLVYPIMIISLPLVIIISSTMYIAKKKSE